MSESFPPERESKPFPAAPSVADAGTIDEETVRAMMAEGVVDAIESGRIYGWAWDRGEPDRRIMIDVYHAGRLLETVCADRFRDDLKRLNLLAGFEEEGDGRHAFAWDIPLDLRSSHPAAFHLCFHGTHVPLERSTRVAQAEAVASDANQVLGNVALALAQRLASVEATVAKALHLNMLLQHELQQGNKAEHLIPHLGKGFRMWAGKIAGHFDERLGEKTASLHEGLGETARATATAIAEMEGFLVRTDEALKRTVRRDDLLDLHRRIRQAMWMTVAAAFAAGVVGAGIGVWTFAQLAMP